MYEAVCVGAGVVVVLAKGARKLDNYLFGDPNVRQSLADHKFDAIFRRVGQEYRELSNQIRARMREEMQIRDRRIGG